MKLSLRLLLVLPAAICTGLFSSCTEQGFTAPPLNGPLGGGGSGAQTVHIPHGITSP